MAEVERNGRKRGAHMTEVERNVLNREVSVRQRWSEMSLIERCP